MYQSLSFQLQDTNEKLEYFSSTITRLMESLCGCATAGYVGDFLTICTDTSPDEIVIQGRAVGMPTVSSAQMVDQLQNFVLDQPAPIVYQGQTLAIVQTCSVTQVTQLGESTCPSEMETETMYTETLDTATKDSTVEALIGGVSGGVLLLVVIALVALVTTFVILRKIRGGKFYKFYNEENTKAPLEM